MADSMARPMRPSSLVMLFAAVGTVVACTPGDGVPPQIALAVPAAAGTCSEWIAQPVERTCIPRMVMADEPLVLEIEQRCGACGSTAERCTVSLEGRTLTFSLDGKTCEPAAGSSCPEDYCGKNRARCHVPPLPEGRYQVRYGDTGGRVDSMDVVVRADAATACSLADAPAR
jgi:hypothetical protein